MERSRTQNTLTNVLVALVDVLVALLKMIAEVFIAFVKLFRGKKLKDVSGEIVLITGSGHGIGRELAVQYADLGSIVICVDINEKGNEETVDIIKSLKKGDAYAYTCDVTIHEKVIELGKKILSEIGHVSILVNNVGIMPTHSIDMHTPEEIRKIFEINVISTFWVLEAFLPHMKKQHRGHIVSMSSMAGLLGLKNLVPYCATKFAVRGMMEALSEEIRAGPFRDLIKFTTVFPFMVDTGLCKYPSIKYPFFLNMITSKRAAEAVIEAQRMEVSEATIPRWLYFLNNAARLMPKPCEHILVDLFGSGVESDLKSNN